MSPHYIALTILFCLVKSNLVWSEEKSHKGYSLVGITPVNEDQYGMILQLSNDDGVSFFNGPYSIGIRSTVLVSPQHRKDVEEFLTSGGIQYSILIDDIQEKIRFSESNKENFNRSKRSPNEEFFKDYQTLDSVKHFMEELNKDYPKLCSIKIIGKTYKRRSLRVLKIASKEEATRPAIWIDAAIHAREWITIPSALYVAYMLLKGYGSESEITKLVDHYTWYIMPVVNPDGYVYTHTNEENRLWRKNLAPISGSKEVGVDLNRNFDYMWGTSSSPSVSDPADETFQGVSAFSERETKSLSNFLTEIKDSLLVYYNLHSFGQRWLTPFGTTGKKPSNYEEMKTVAEIGINAVKNFTGANYLFSPAYELYQTTGIAIDWVNDALGTKYCYTVEIETFPHKYDTPEPRIIVRAKEIWYAVKAIGLYLMEK